jgi:hypothetical protein
LFDVYSGTKHKITIDGDCNNPITFFEKHAVFAAAEKNQLSFYAIDDLSKPTHTIKTTDNILAIYKQENYCCMATEQTDLKNNLLKNVSIYDLNNDFREIISDVCCTRGAVNFPQVSPCGRYAVWYDSASQRLSNLDTILIYDIQQKTRKALECKGKAFNYMQKIRWSKDSSFFTIYDSIYKNDRTLICDPQTGTIITTTPLVPDHVDGTLWQTEPGREKSIKTYNTPETLKQWFDRQQENLKKNK